MTSFYQEPDHTIYCGHALDILKQMPAESVDMVITSPPYWGLRTYKTEPIIWGDNHCEHEWGELILHKLDNRSPAEKGRGTGLNCAKDKSRAHPFIANSGEAHQGNFCLKCHAWKGELGLEPTIELYIDHLIQIFDEVKRVLKKTGTCWVNIDDSYAGGGQGGGDWGGKEVTRSSDYGHLKIKEVAAKSLCLIPSRFALAMVNSGWILRNDICWNKSNPMPESVKDRFTGSWEHLFFFTKAQRYWFEQQFEPMAYPDRVFNPDASNHSTIHLEDSRTTKGLHDGRTQYGTPELGRNKRDVWLISTEPTVAYRGIKNFATFPEKLCETPILAGCPSMICKNCGKAREKIYKTGLTDHGGNTQSSYPEGTTAKRLALLRQAARKKGSEYANNAEVVGYTDCGCNAVFEPGVVLDPFCGSGKALAVAKKLGRKSVGIDLNPDYCKLSVKALQAVSLAMPLLVN